MAVISATPRGNRLPDSLDRPKTSITLESGEGKGGNVKVMSRSGGEEVAGLKARLEIAMKNEDYLRQELLVMRR